MRLLQCTYQHQEELAILRTCQRGLDRVYTHELHELTHRAQHYGIYRNVPLIIQPQRGKRGLVFQGFAVYVYPGTHDGTYDAEQDASYYALIQWVQAAVAETLAQSSWFRQVRWDRAAVVTEP